MSRPAYRGALSSARPSNSTGVRKAWSPAASTTGYGSHTRSCVRAARSGWWPTQARATRCCSMRTRGRSWPWAVWLAAASLTTCAPPRTRSTRARVAPSTRDLQFSVAEMLEHERPHLMPMPESLDGYVEKPARVSGTCLVSVARNRYSVPCELAGQMVSSRLYPGSVVVVANDAVAARHERLSDSGGRGMLGGSLIEEADFALERDVSAALCLSCRGAARQTATAENRRT
jgi:hypothetical protein